MTEIRLHFGLCRYHALLTQGRLGPWEAEALARALGAIEKPRVVVYGSRTTTGEWFRQAAGARFVTYLNSDTFSPALGFRFNTVIVGASPQHYGQILDTLARLNKRRLNVILPFEAEHPAEFCDLHDTLAPAASGPLDRQTQERRLHAVFDNLGW